MDNIKAPNILWVAPNLNHYKTRFLSRLAQQSTIQLTVLAGRMPVDKGHVKDDDSQLFKHIGVAADKNNFAYHAQVYALLTNLIRSRQYDVVLMPFERKFLPIILYLKCMSLMKGFRLVSYNHPMTGTVLRPLKISNRILVRFIFCLYDRIIFYTEKGRDRAIDQGLIKHGKAFYANNTLDTRAIWEKNVFEINESEAFTLLFIGRLVPRRQLDVLWKYFQALKKHIPNIRLVIIGDGPEAAKVQSMAALDKAIEWRGAVVDEWQIAEEMKKIHIVLMPGDSGLSIVHAFCYGKPYVTSGTCSGHGPELDYLVDGKNGLLLSGDCEADCARIANILQDRVRYRDMCNAAINTASKLSIESWCEKIEHALTF